MKKYFFGIILITLLSCNNKSNTPNKPITGLTLNKEKPKCSDSLLMNKLLQKVIDIKNLQQYFSASDVKFGYLFLKKDPLINRQYQLEKFSKNIVLLSEDEIKNNNVTAFIEFNEIKISENKAKASVTLVYRFEGLQCTAQLKKDENCDWVLLSSDIIEM